MSKIKNGGLDQYGAGTFEQQQFGTAGVEGVKVLNLWETGRDRECPTAVYRRRLSVGHNATRGRPDDDNDDDADDRGASTSCCCCCCGGGGGRVAVAATHSRRACSYSQRSRWRGRTARCLMDGRWRRRQPVDRQVPRWLAFHQEYVECRPPVCLADEVMRHIVSTQLRTV